MILNSSPPEPLNAESPAAPGIPAIANNQRRPATDRSWCGPEFIMLLLGGKWSTRILYLLINNGPKRFTGLLHDLDGISNKELASQLKYMINRKLIIREDNRHREYAVTPLGGSLEKVFNIMDEWSENFLHSLEEKG